LTKIGYDCYLFGERAQEFIIFFIEVRRLILIECGLTRVAPETVETVEWKKSRWRAICSSMKHSYYGVTKPKRGPHTVLRRHA
jgi:hypothetical protein